MTLIITEALTIGPVIAKVMEYGECNYQTLSGQSYTLVLRKV